MPTLLRPPCWTLDDIDQMSGLDPVAFARERERLVLVAIARFRNPEDGHDLQNRIDALRWGHADPGHTAAQLIRIAHQLALRATTITDRLKRAATGGSPDPA